MDIFPFVFMAKVILGLAFGMYFMFGPNFSYYWFLFNGLWIHLHDNNSISRWKEFKWLFEKYSNINIYDQDNKSILATMSAIEFYLISPICILIAVRLKHNKHPILTNYLIGIISCAQIVCIMLLAANEWSKHFISATKGTLDYDPVKLFHFVSIFIGLKPFWIILPLLEANLAYERLMDLQIQQK